MKYFLIALLGLSAACTPVMHCETSQQLTTGIVQREIYLEMPASDVAAILGSPNIVTLDENKHEVWVYDKVSSQVEYCTKRSGIWLVIAGNGTQRGYSKRSQKTLTVIVKFDENKRVKDFTYHSSSF